MSDNAIVVENLSKSYLLGHKSSAQAGTNMRRCGMSSDVRSAISRVRRQTSSVVVRLYRATRSRSFGRSRIAEIRRKFDEIVAFAQVEKFLDTPVKHYSSGMYVRLAFAVAAHLEPDILVIDEVLAVGDAEFQRKCLGKM